MNQKIFRKCVSSFEAISIPNLYEQKLLSEQIVDEVQTQNPTMCFLGRCQREKPWEL